MDERLDETIAAAGGLSRRTVNKGLAWSVPVIVGAFAAPAESASTVDTTPQATLSLVTAQKGQKDSQNRQVWLTLSFTGVVGDNQVVVTGITGGSWDVTGATATVNPDKASVTIMVTRLDSNASQSFTLSCTVNGSAYTAPFTIISTPVKDK